LELENLYGIDGHGPVPPQGGTLVTYRVVGFHQRIL
jgi:hypothetical protein